MHSAIGYVFEITASFSLIFHKRTLAGASISSFKCSWVKKNASSSSISLRLRICFPWSVFRAHEVVSRLSTMDTRYFCQDRAPVVLFRAFSFVCFTLLRESFVPVWSSPRLSKSWKFSSLFSLLWVCPNLAYRWKHLLISSIKCGLEAFLSKPVLLSLYRARLQMGRLFHR